MTSFSAQEVAQMVDHTLLAPEATGDDIAKLVADAKAVGAFSVCVSPHMLPICNSDGHPIDLGNLKLAVVCGFPSGAHPAAVKAHEAALCAAVGVDEIDMVINLRFAKEQRWDELEAEIAAVRQAAPGVLLKVILETAALTDEEIVEGCKASERAGADYVKTSTGYHKAGGASVHAIELMAKTVAPRLGVKASGGIRDGKFASELIAAGATRLGLSSTAQVLSTL